MNPKDIKKPVEQELKTFETFFQAILEKPGSVASENHPVHRKTQRETNAPFVCIVDG